MVDKKHDAEEGRSMNLNYVFVFGVFLNMMKLINLRKMLARLPGKTTGKSAYLK